MRDLDLVNAPCRGSASSCDQKNAWAEKITATLGKGAYDICKHPGKAADDRWTKDLKGAYANP